MRRRRTQPSTNPTVTISSGTGTAYRALGRIPLMQLHVAERRGAD